MINFSHACKNNIDEIISFINNNWKKDHILVRNRKVFNFYYCNNQNKPQFFIAKENNNKIVGILGYITNKQFDKNIRDNGAWLSIWCSKIGISGGIGIMLLNKLELSLDVDFISCLGVGSDVLPIYKRFGYQAGKISHFKKNINSKKPRKNYHELIERGLSENNLDIKAFGKSIEYIKKKYKRSRFYKYYFFSIKRDGKIKTILVGRILKYNNNNIFRIIDYIGDIEGLSVFANKFDFNAIDKSINFIDVLCWSPFYTVNLQGFSKCNKKDFLPLYFEPLINSYCEKNFIFKKIKNVDDNFLIITGDGDQDRPNKIQ